MNSLFKGLMIVFCLALASCLPAPHCPQKSEEEAKKSQQALTDFAVNLFKQVSSHDEDKNQAVSPLSIALGLALLESGADGKTREEIKKVLLETSASREDVLSVYINLQEQLKINQDKTQLTIANGLFQDKDLKLKDDFISVIKNCFKSEVDQVDFQNQLEQARQKVNQFISEKNPSKNPPIVQTRRFDLVRSFRIGQCFVLQSLVEKRLQSKIDQTRHLLPQWSRTTKRSIHARNRQPSSFGIRRCGRFGIALQ